MAGSENYRGPEDAQDLRARAAQARRIALLVGQERDRHALLDLARRDEEAAAQLDDTRGMPAPGTARIGVRAAPR